MLQIQDGSQITGSTNKFAGFVDTHVVPKTIQGFITTCMYEASKCPAVMASCLSSNISETMTYIIKIPMGNLRHSTIANSQKVYLGDSNNERQSEMAAENRKYLSRGE